MKLFERAALMLSGLALSLALVPAMADPPALVGRIAVAEGAVRLIPDPGAEAIASPQNFPVVADARLLNGSNGRAAIQVGHVSLWLGEDSELAFVQLDEDVLALDLASGVLAASVAAAMPEREAPVLISTLPAQVSLLGPGRYRVQSDTIEARVIVSDGLARVSAGKDVAYVSAGQTLVVTTGGVVSHAMSDPAVEGDAFAHWVAAHDVPLTGETTQYVSPAMTGWQDLEAHGSWQETVEYGPLWIPAHDPHGWAPYRHGKWVWLNPWGWTWIDRAPWGFAPFHYGRWLHLSGRWCWSPGRFVHRPVFAPALVVFISSEGKPFRPHRHRPPSKWVALGPRDPFEPHFEASPRFKERVNAPHFARHHAHDARSPVERALRNRDEVRRRHHGEADFSVPKWHEERSMSQPWGPRQEVHPDFRPRSRPHAPGFSTEADRPPTVQPRDGRLHRHSEGFRHRAPHRVEQHGQEREEGRRQHFGDSPRRSFGERPPEAVPRHRSHSPDSVRAEGSPSEPRQGREFRSEQRSRWDRDAWTRQQHGEDGLRARRERDRELQIRREHENRDVRPRREHWDPDVRARREAGREAPTVSPGDTRGFAPSGFGQARTEELRRGRATLPDAAPRTAPTRDAAQTRESRRPFRGDGGFDRGSRREGSVAVEPRRASEARGVERRGGVWGAESRGPMSRRDAGGARGFSSAGTR